MIHLASRRIDCCSLIFNLELFLSDGLIRILADFDSLAFPNGGESESLSQTGGLRCDQGFRYVKILMVNVSGG